MYGWWLYDQTGLEIVLEILDTLRVGLEDLTCFKSKLLYFLWTLSANPCFQGIDCSYGHNLSFNHWKFFILSKMKVRHVYFHIPKALEQDVKSVHGEGEP